MCCDTTPGRAIFGIVPFCLEGFAALPAGYSGWWYALAVKPGRAGCRLAPTSLPRLLPVRPCGRRTGFAYGPVVSVWGVDNGTVWDVVLALVTFHLFTCNTYQKRNALLFCDPLQTSAWLKRYVVFSENIRICFQQRRLFNVIGPDCLIESWFTWKLLCNIPQH